MGINFFDPYSVPLVYVSVFLPLLYCSTDLCVTLCTNPMQFHCLSLCQHPAVPLICVSFFVLAPCCFSYCSFVACFELRCSDVFSFIKNFFLTSTFDILDLLWFPMDFKCVSFNSVKNVSILIKTALTLDCLGNLNILSNFHSLQRYLPFFCHERIILSILCSFYCTSLLFLWWNLFLNIWIFADYCKWDFKSSVSANSALWFRKASVVYTFTL